MMASAVARLENWLWESPEEQVPEECRPVQRLVKQFAAEEFSVFARDGIELKCSYKRGKPGAKVMFCFAPLGQSNMMSYWPVVQHFGEEYTYLSWQYRGFFDSDLPKRERRVSIRDHAEDAKEVLHKARELGIIPDEYADVIISHSMGVSVCLEFVLLYPHLCHTLVMMNGSYGSVFDHAFQVLPLVRVPYTDRVADWLVSYLASNNPSMFVKGVKACVTSKPMTRLQHWAGEKFGNQHWLKAVGPTYFSDLFHVYLGGISSNEHSSSNWIRGFQELHAHSAKHLIDKIEHPTLLLSGRLDYLTPSYVMEEMAQTMPNAVHKTDYFSTHFTIVENPNFIVKEVDEFLVKNEIPRRFKRLDSMHFQATSVEVFEQ